MTAPDPEPTVLARFTAALPTPIRHRFRHNTDTIRAVHHLANQGTDPGELAAAVAAGLAHRSTRDVQALIRHRLLRRAGLLDEQQEN